MKKLIHKNGTLTAYGFACGYVEKHPLTADGGEITLHLAGGFGMCRCDALKSESVSGSASTA